MGKQNPTPPVQPETPTTTLPSQETPKPPKSLLKWLVIALIVLLTGTAGFLSFQVYGLKKQISSRPTPTAWPPEVRPTPTPTPDETANWKTYTNTKYKYSLKYPETWFSTDCGILNGLLLSPLGVPECATEPAYPIQFFVDVNRKTIEQYVNSISTSGFKATFKEQGLNGSQKYLIEKVEAAPGPEKFTEVVIPTEQGLFIMTVNDIEQESLADQILSTFRFINQ